MPKVQSTEIYLTKIAAAQRQLDAAIRMFFCEEDELAIHTVAAAAYRIIRDLRMKRNLPEIPDELFLVGFFKVAKDFAEGRETELSLYIKKFLDLYKDPNFTEFINFIHNEEKKLGRKIDVDDIKIHAIGDAKSYWKKFVLVENFLKHADLDHDQSLSLSKLKIDKLLLRCSGSYVRLTKHITPEMRVYSLYFFLTMTTLSDKFSDFDSQDARILSTLSKLDPKSRRKACFDLITILKKIRERA